MARSRLWEKNNPEKVKESDRRYYQKNSTNILERCRIWRQDNIERNKETKRKYYQDHSDEIKRKTLLWQKQNPERANKNASKWAREHPEQRKLASLRRRVVEMNAEGDFTIGEWDLLKKQYGYTCPCCDRKEPEISLTIDHIIPLIKGGSNYIENIQPLCQSCNSSKNTKIIKYDNKL